MKITQAIAALAGVAAASQPVNESTEAYATKCNYASRIYPNRNYAGCRRVLKFKGCMVGKKLYYTYKNNNKCRDIGGHPVQGRVRKCGAARGYTYARKRICIKDQLRWGRAPGAAWNIAYNGKKVWVIGTNVEGGGYGIYRWDGHWTKIPGSAIRAAVDASGRGWVVNKGAYIYGYNGSGWVRVAGRAWDIDVSVRNKLWVIGTNAEAGGFGIYCWVGRWSKIPGSAVRIAVDGSQNAWVVNKYRAIYRHTGARWIRTNGAAFDVAAHDGNVAVVGTDRKAYRRWYQRNTWTQTNGGALKSIALGAGNLMLGTVTNAGIWVGR